MSTKQKINKKLTEIDEQITKKYDIKKRLGKGAYGIVWKAADKSKSQTVAVKKIFDAFRNDTDAQRTFREITFLRAFRNHPNIIRLFEIHKAANNMDMYLIFEYMETDLHNVIKRGTILKDIHKRFIMYQLLNAIKYIHSGNVIHRDLKPSNILLDSKCRCKIADFGLARSVSNKQITNENSITNLNSKQPILTDYVATRWYRAPEILVASKKYTKGIDMWSIGCILGEMLRGKPLFPGSSTLNQIEKIIVALPEPTDDDIAAVGLSFGSVLLNQKIQNSNDSKLGDLIAGAPEDAKNLVKSLLLFNPELRLTAKQAIKHEYISKFRYTSPETELKYDILPSFRDDVQLTVSEYRSKLYEVVGRGGIYTDNGTTIFCEKGSKLENSITVQAINSEANKKSYRCQQQNSDCITTTTTINNKKKLSNSNNNRKSIVINHNNLLPQTQNHVPNLSSDTIIYSTSTLAAGNHKTTVKNNSSVLYDKSTNIAGRNNNNNNNSNQYFNNLNNRNSIINNTRTQSSSSSSAANLKLKYCIKKSGTLELENNTNSSSSLSDKNENHSSNNLRTTTTRRQQQQQSKLPTYGEINDDNDNNKMITKRHSIDCGNITNNSNFLLGTNYNYQLLSSTSIDKKQGTLNGSLMTLFQNKNNEKLVKSKKDETLLHQYHQQQQQQQHPVMTIPYFKKSQSLRKCHSTSLDDGNKQHQQQHQHQHRSSVNHHNSRVNGRRKSDSSDHHHQLYHQNYNLNSSSFMMNTLKSQQQRSLYESGDHFYYKRLKNLEDKIQQHKNDIKTLFTSSSQLTFKDNNNKHHRSKTIIGEKSTDNYSNNGGNNNNSNNNNEYNDSSINNYTIDNKINLKHSSNSVTKLKDNTLRRKIYLLRSKSENSNTIQNISKGIGGGGVFDNSNSYNKHHKLTTIKPIKNEHRKGSGDHNHYNHNNCKTATIMKKKSITNDFSVLTAKDIVNLRKSQVISS